MNRPRITARYLLILFGLIVLVAASSGPAGAATLRVGYSSSIGFSHVPSLMALEVLKNEGIDARAVFFPRPEVTVTALGRGDIDIGGASIVSTLLAIERGADLRILSAQYGNEWVLLARSDIKSCADLDGKRLAIHSETSSHTPMVRSWLANHCPKSKPVFLIIPGSDARASALLAGRIDVSPVELSDAVSLEQKTQGLLVRLASFNRDLPDLLTNVFSTRATFAAENGGLVRAFLRALLQTHRQIAANPDVWVAAIQRYLPDMERGDAERLAKAYIDAGIFDPNGGLTPKALAYSLDFYRKAGAVAGQLDPSTIADFVALADAVADLKGTR